MEEWCPECDNVGFLYDTSRGDVLCPMCGCIIFDREPDFEHQTKSYTVGTSTGKRESCSHDVSSTIPIIGYTVYNVKETKNIDQSNSTLERLAHAQKFNSIEWKKVRLIHFNQKVSQIVSILNLPPLIQKEVMYYFQKTDKIEYFRGRKIKYILPVLLLEILHQYKHGLSQKEILKAFGFESDILFNNHEFNTTQKNLHILMTQKGWFHRNQNEQLEKTILFIQCFADPLGITFIHQQLMIKLIIRHFHSFSGQKSSGIAAGALYFLCQNLHIPKTQQEISKILEVNEITLRTSYKKCVQIIKIKRKKDIISVSKDPKALLISNG